VAQQQRDAAQQRSARQREEAEKRADALRAICEHLKVGEGAAIADIGAGGGRDTWVFADIVGQEGTVYAEEIEAKMCDTIREEAEKRGLAQVKAVEGTATSPELPADSVNMAFMHHVFHHVSHPREMLGGIWKSLKPGGYLVVVDQRFGTLVDWVPREDRAKKHYWIAETTVVREARETGFAFVEYAESLWHAQDSFVLVFQRPTALAAPDRDPDPLGPIPADIVNQLLPPAGETYERVAFVALGEGRQLMKPLLDATSCPAVDIVLEEWATQKDERPATPAGIELPTVLTEKGDPRLGPEPLDAVFFLDTYHLLFHGPTLLKQLQERLTSDGRVFVLDRAAEEDISHREASHRRRIPPELVQREMDEAGFKLLREIPVAGDDRFLLLFGK
jgi:predicted methyltransferase